MSNIAYVRVSTAEQNEQRQIEALKRHNIDKWFIEKVSGKDTNRSKLKDMLDYIREDDTVYIHDFSRLARSTKDLLEIVELLNAKKVHLVSNKENLDTSTPTGKLMLTMIAAINEFERQNLLDDVIKTGTALDCGVSSELLKNIFWNKAPLHDGAVIVRKGRIVGAGCMLPLSGNVNLSRDLGMRHRAGIGMSEHSDAVVVIVSEETGSISAAVGGMLKRHLAPETLERLLRNELLNDKQEEKKGNQIPLLGLLMGQGKKEEGEQL